MTRPIGCLVKDIWEGYRREKSGRSVLEPMKYTWKALEPHFGEKEADQIGVADCRSYIAARKAVREARSGKHGVRKYPNGIHDGTIHTELGHLRMVLLWAEKTGLIKKAPHIERPPKPSPSEKHLTREEAAALVRAADDAHLKLFILLGMATGGRSSALLQLTWSRVDFKSDKIDLRNPEISTPHKGRAIVPMNRMLRTALLAAQERAISRNVIEWAGEPVRSVKKGLASAAAKAGLPRVTPHMLRHSSAVHMAEAGVSMEEIAQYLGHRNVNVTRNVYARFSPHHLKSAAATLDYGDFDIFRDDEGERNAN